MVRRQVHQFDLYPMVVDERHQAFHELRTGTGDLGTIVEFDVETFDTWMDRFALLPPEFQAIGDEVAGLFGMAKEEPRLLDRHRAAMQFEYAKRDQQGVGRHIMIESLDRLRSPCQALTGEGADFDFGFGIDGDAERVRLARRQDTDALDVLEDRVGFGNFFSGRVFKTRRSR